MLRLLLRGLLPGLAGLLLAGPARCQQADSLALPGAELYYYTYGRGEPLLVLSGGPGIAAQQEDDVARQLGRYFRVILLDQRGTGRSRTTPFDSTTINLRQAVADVEALRRHLGLRRLNLYGHSWGAMLGAAYVAAHPRRVGLLVAVSGRELHLPQPIRRYRGPVLVVYGLHDAIGLTTAPQYLQAFPQAQLHGIAQCGHYPAQEQPGAFYGVLGAFLGRHMHPAAPPR